MRGCAGVCKTVGEGSFYNGGKSEIFKMAVLLTKQVQISSYIIILCIISPARWSIKKINIFTKKFIKKCNKTANLKILHFPHYKYGLFPLFCITRAYPLILFFFIKKIRVYSMNKNTEFEILGNSVGPLLHFLGQATTQRRKGLPYIGLRMYSLLRVEKALHWRVIFFPTHGREGLCQTENVFPELGALDWRRSSLYWTGCTCIPY